MSRDVEQGIEARFEDYLTKQIKVAKILEIVEEYLGRSDAA